MWTASRPKAKQHLSRRSGDRVPRRTRLQAYAHPAQAAILQASACWKHQPRLRAAAAGMPIASRYFATVLREMCTPFSASIFEMRISLRGLSFASPRMRREISSHNSRCVWLPSEPPTLREKRFVSARQPRSHCTYFPCMARLTVDSCMSTRRAISARVMLLGCEVIPRKNGS